MKGDRPESATDDSSGNRRMFYEQFQSLGDDGAGTRSEEQMLARFVQEHGLENKRVLEVGSGRGDFQHLSKGWIGLDYSFSAGGFASRPFVTACAESLPFRCRVFDAVWSIAVLEHVPEPEDALLEILRVLKPGGVAFLAPAWHCRPWAADGLHVRPFSALTWPQRLIKLSIPLREALVFRGVREFPFRLVREATYALNPSRPRRFRYKRLKANYHTFWCADSDACNSMDPHEMLLWFVSRGCSSLSHSSLVDRLLVRHGAIVVGKSENKQRDTGEDR